MHRLSTFCLFLVFASVSGVEAQSVQRPTRPFRGLFGGGPPADETRSRNELSLTAGLSGGYEEQLPVGGASGSEVGDPLDGGQSWSGDAIVNYFHGRSVRSLTIAGRVYGTRYSTVSDTLVGGELQVRGYTNVGRRNHLEITQLASYQPTLMLGAFTPLHMDVHPGTLPGEGQSSNFVRQSSWATNTSGSISRDWSARQSTSAEFAYSQVLYMDNIGFDSRRQTGAAQHSWTFSRTSSIQGSYRVSSGHLGEDGGEGVPLKDQNVEVGFSYSRRLSPSRQIRISAGGGSTYVDTLHSLNRAPLQYWMPSGHGSFSVDLGRSWALLADYRRAASVLPGVTLQSFAADVARVRVDGLIGRRVEWVTSAAFSNGRAGGSENSGTFESYTGTVQIRYALGRSWALSTNYQYYYYHLGDVVAPQPNVPMEYGQHSVRVGITTWLPLYGTHDSASRGRGARQ